jgi:hypothetical protein
LQGTGEDAEVSRKSLRLTHESELWVRLSNVPDWIEEQNPPHRRVLLGLIVTSIEHTSSAAVNDVLKFFLLC